MRRTLSSSGIDPPVPSGRGIRHRLIVLASLSKMRATFETPPNCSMMLFAGSQVCFCITLE